MVGRTFSNACLRSWLACIRSQNPSLRPKKRQRRRSVSAVIARLPLTMALMRLSGTSMAVANRYWLIPIGLRNSSNNTSPGGTRSKSLSLPAASRMASLRKTTGAKLPKRRDRLPLKQGPSFTAAKRPDHPPILPTSCIGTHNRTSKRIRSTAEHPQRGIALVIGCFY